MSSEIAVVEHDQQPGGLSLIEGPDPAGAVAYARQVSASIAGVLEERSGYVTIQKSKHITIEGWQTLAAMTGHTVEVEWSRPVDGLEPNAKGVRAWEARAVVHDQSGRVVAAGESMAEPGEGGKWDGSNSSVRSMAQTRAMSRALSSRMRYIVQLAGFSGTPAEEMPHAEPAESDRDKARRRFKVLRDEVEIDEALLKKELGDDGPQLADDYFYAALAHSCGYLKGKAEAEDEAPIDGDVVTDDEAVADEIGQQTLGDE